VSFALDPQAAADAREAEQEHFRPPHVDGLADVAVAYPENKLRVISDPLVRRTYLDALMDLHFLVDEYRFEALLGLALLRDYAIKRDRGDAPTLKLTGDARFDQMAWPAETVVVMQRHARTYLNALMDLHERVRYNAQLVRRVRHG
jgi:hypothetical protein